MRRKKKDEQVLKYNLKPNAIWPRLREVKNRFVEILKEIRIMKEIRITMI